MERAGPFWQTGGRQTLWSSSHSAQKVLAISLAVPGAELRCRVSELEASYRRCRQLLSRCWASIELLYESPDTTTSNRNFKASWRSCFLTSTTSFCDHSSDLFGYVLYSCIARAPGQFVGQ